MKNLMLATVLTALTGSPSFASTQTIDLVTHKLTCFIDVLNPDHPLDVPLKELKKVELVLDSAHQNVETKMKFDEQNLTVLIGASYFDEGISIGTSMESDGVQSVSNANAPDPGQKGASVFSMLKKGNQDFGVICRQGN